MPRAFVFCGSSWARTASASCTSRNCGGFAKKSRGHRNCPEKIRTPEHSRCVRRKMKVPNSSAGKGVTSSHSANSDYAQC